VLTSGNVNSVFKFATGSVNGDNSFTQQLQTIDLTQLGTTAATGMNIAITAKPGVGGGDGFANVGFINGTDINLGTVSVHGDLGRINAGNGTSASKGLTSLSVHSMGRFGTSTQAAGGSLESDISGQLGKLSVASDIVGAYINVTGPGGSVLGTIGSVTVGGSLIGGSDTDSGSIRAGGNIGAVAIGQDMQGSSGQFSGMITSNGKLASAKIGGSIIGGSGQFSGLITCNGDMGAITIGRDLQGGSGGESGAIQANSKLASAKIGGSVIGGSFDDAGLIASSSDMGAVAIGGSLQGGNALDSGIINCEGKLTSIKIGGSVTGGSGEQSGEIYSNSDMGAVTIGGSLIVGTVVQTGEITSGGGIMGQVKIGGSIVGSASVPAIISALGQATPKAPNDLAIAGLTVGGRVEDAQILAGYSFNGSNLNPTSADAQIGNVSVGGDWIASNLLAGATPTGSGQFEKITGGTDNAAITSSIASITIAGEVLGTLPTLSNTDSYGFAAELVKSFTIGGTKIKLLSGLDNDYFAIGTTVDVALEEV
jgi:hypothetical protein